VIAVDSSVHTKDNDQDHCFSIIVNNSAFNVVPPTTENANDPNATNDTNDNNNNAKAKKAKSNKNQVVYQLRADTEDIMVFIYLFIYLFFINCYYYVYDAYKIFY